MVQNRYEEGIRRGHTIESSVKSAVRDTGSSVAVAVMTSVVGFSSLFSTRVPSLEYFGFTLIIGLTFSFFLSITLLPAILIVTDRRRLKRTGRLFKPNKRVRGEAGLEKFLLLISRNSSRHPVIVFVSISFIAVIGLYGTLNVELEVDPLKYLPDDMEAFTNLDFLAERFGGGSDILLVAFSTEEVYDPEFMELMYSIGEYVRMKEEKITGASSFAIELHDTFDHIPKDEWTIREFAYRMPEHQRDQYLSGNTKALLTFYLKDIEGMENSNILKRVRGHIKFQHPEAEFIFAGSPIFKEGISTSMISGQRTITILSITLVFIILMLMYRSISASLTALLPVVVVIVMTGGAMYALGISHTMLSVTMNSIIIGVGIDFSIHIIERYKEERRKGMSPEEALEITTASIGKSLMTTANTTAFGFLAMVVSPFPLFQWFGMMAFLAIMFSLFTTLVMVPPLLNIAERYGLCRYYCPTCNKKIKCSKISMEGFFEHVRCPDCLHSLINRG